MRYDCVVYLFVGGFSDCYGRLLPYVGLVFVGRFCRFVLDIAVVGLILGLMVLYRYRRWDLVSLVLWGDC